MQSVTEPNQKRGKTS